MTSSPGQKLAEETKEKFPGKTIHEIASLSGASIIYEEPLDIGNLIRISEYRPKTSQIVIFHKEKEREAVGHELFHHLEKIKRLKLSKEESEKEAAIFANTVLTTKHICCNIYNK